MKRVTKKLTQIKEPTFFRYPVGGEEVFFGYKQLGGTIFFLIIDGKICTREDADRDIYPSKIVEIIPFKEMKEYGIDVEPDEDVFKRDDLWGQKLK